MKQLWGWILSAVGLVVTLAGMAMALRPVVQIYSAAMNDPLSDKGPQDGASVGRAMIPGLAIGAVGVVLLLVGSILLKVSLIQRLMKKQQQR